MPAPMRSPCKYAGVYDHSFLGDSVWSFFSSPPQCAIFGTGIFGLIASFERRLRGAAQSPSPCRIRSAPGRDRVRGLSETSEKCANFCILGGIRPSYSWISAYADLERKKLPGMGKRLFPSWHHFQIGFLFRSHHTFFMVTPRSVWSIVHIVRLTAVSLLFDIGFQG